MYAYLLPFQHDMDIILLPYKKTSKKVKKHITINGEKYQKMTKMIYSCKGKLAALYGKQGERMLTRIHRENPKALFINKFTTNPFASYLLV